MIIKLFGQGTQSGPTNFDKPALFSNNISTANYSDKRVRSLTGSEQLPAILIPCQIQNNSAVGRANKKSLLMGQISADSHKEKV